MLSKILQIRPGNGVSTTKSGSLMASSERITSLKETLLKEEKRLLNECKELESRSHHWDTLIRKENQSLRWHESDDVIATGYADEYYNRRSKPRGHMQHAYSQDRNPSRPLTLSELYEPCDCGCISKDDKKNGMLIRPFSEDTKVAIKRLISQAEEFKKITDAEIAEKRETMKKISDQLEGIALIQSRLSSVSMDKKITQMLRDKSSAVSGYTNKYDSIFLNEKEISREIKQMQYSTEALLELGRND